MSCRECNLCGWMGNKDRCPNCGTINAWDEELSTWYSEEQIDEGQEEEDANED